MKKIQVTTVEQTAQVQVINLNSYLVAKSVHAMLTMQRALEGTRVPKTTTPPDGESKQVMENGKPVYDYFSCEFHPEAIKALHENVLSFLEELCNAFEEAE